MTIQSSGGSGSGLPGVTSDKLTPGGEIIAGALTAGDPTATSVPSLHRLRGATNVSESPGNQVDFDDVLDVVQASPLVGNHGANLMFLWRNGTLNGFDYQQSLLLVQDSTASTAPLATYKKSSTTQFQVDSDGIQVHGKFKVGSAVTHTLGAYSGKSLPIYDESGTLVGYAPCYA